MIKIKNLNNFSFEYLDGYIYIIPNIYYISSPSHSLEYYNISINDRCLTFTNEEDAEETYAFIMEMINEYWKNNSKSASHINN